MTTPDPDVLPITSALAGLGPLATPTVAFGVPPLGPPPQPEPGYRFVGCVARGRAFADSWETPAEVEAELGFRIAAEVRVFALAERAGGMTGGDRCCEWSWASRRWGRWKPAAAI